MVPAVANGTDTQATVESVRFFKAASGAPAAEFSGHECVLAAPNGADIGKCPWYHIIVTDGASIHKPDTFCGGRCEDRVLLLGTDLRGHPDLLSLSSCFSPARRELPVGLTGLAATPVGSDC